MACDAILKVMGEYGACENTQDGCRYVTQCVYPSFDPVAVFVTKFGDGYHVHDGGGAARNAWIHGRDDKAFQRIMDRHARRFGLSFEQDTFACVVHGADWLQSAIIAVANTSAAASLEAVEHIAVTTERALKAKIDAVLTETVPAQNIGRGFEIRGKSGKLHEFDFIVRREEFISLMDAVAPHHVSISSKYVAFSDTEIPDQPTHKYAIYERDLEPSDTSLMQQVADLVPFSALRFLMSKPPHNGREIIRGP